MHTVGAVVDGFELTASGEWVRVSPTAGSPYRLGDVVDGHMLTADLRWVPLRRAASAPYVAGDVVDEHVLTPQGEWVPLAERVRERVASSGRARTARPAPTSVGADASAAERAARRAAEQRLAAERAADERRAAAERASAQQRAADQQAAAERAAEQRAATQRAAQQDASARTSTTGGGTAAPARRTYRVGDVVNGHVLTPDNRWVPVAAPGSSPQRPRPQQQTPGSGYRRVAPFLVAAFVLIQVLRACGG
ncbi:hypothetical protein [Cellulomonas sp. B6]|jgi:hypothetical protein|uniref:hypothetical protein n=1 Tax=Cellulomonas sp. B6 TaxID=1295626 RepID=UPI00073C95DA|nr:hypothetical protein [Cellulomonas sp. B6]KSW28609.1 hypothetical protein ATM99_11365 [Cellulomonas sp. B6]